MKKIWHCGLGCLSLLYNKRVMLLTKTTITMEMINFEGTMMPVATLKTLFSPMPWFELYKMSVVIEANFPDDKDKMQLVDILDELVIKKKGAEIKAQLGIE